MISRLLLCSILLSGCQIEGETINIEWSIGEKLPDDNSIANIGLAGPVTGIINKNLLIFGGANFPDKKPWEGGVKLYQPDVYVYDIDANGNLSFSHKFSYHDSVAYAANLSINNSIISIGGERNGVAINDGYQYFFNNNVLGKYKLASLPEALTNGGIAAIKNDLFFVGGENSELVSNKIYKLKLNAQNDSQWDLFFELPIELCNSVVVSDGNKYLYILGGRKRNVNSLSTIYNSVYRLNIENKKIENITSLPKSVAAGTGFYYEDNLIVVGGDDATTFHKVEELIALINLENDETLKADFIREKNALQSAHPGFPKDVWSYNLTTKTWIKLHDLTGESPVTTSAIVKDNMVYIPTGEVKAGVRTNQIIMGKIK